MNYEKLAQLTAQKIEKYGRSISLKHKGQVGYDPILDDISSGFTLRTVKGLFVNYELGEVDGQLIQNGDKQCLVFGKVDIKDSLIDEGDEYNIVTISEVSPGDTLLFSRLQVRR